MAPPIPMAARLPLAFLLGLVIYLVAVAMTVYDGLLSLVLQPIAGAIVTALSLLVLLIAGSPLLIGRVWRQWRRAGWLVLLLAAIGIAALVLSWHPSLRVQVTDPDTGATIESFHPTLSIAGWFLILFGVAFCPAIGFRGDRRWV